MNAAAQRRKGIALFVAAWAIVPVMDACAKILGNLDYPIWMIVWARFAVSFIMLMPLMMMNNRVTFGKPPHLPLQVLRALLLVAATLGFYSGLKTLPMADALAIYFVYPFLITAFSPLVLGEMPGTRRWIAIGVGFVGSLLVIRPGFGVIPLGTGYVLVAAVAFAGYNLLTRQIAGDGGHWQVLVFQTIVGTVVTAPALLFTWHTPDLYGVMLLLGIGFAATLGHYLLIRAYQYAPAPILAPFSYFEIVSATVLGVAVFGDFPSALTWVGVAVIITSGVFTSLRERKINYAAGGGVLNSERST